MINRMVTRNLMHRPIRTLLSVMAIALEVAMILMMVGLSEGLLQESQRRTRGIGADIMIRPSTSSAAQTLSSADISEKLIPKLGEMYPEISIATGTVVHTPGDLQTITGVDWEKLDAMSGGIRFFSGGPVRQPYDAVIDEVYAKYKKLAVGDKLRLLNRDFTVTGIVETGKMSRVFIPLETMQDLMGAKGKFSQILLKLRDPARTRELVTELKEVLPTYPVYAMEDFLTQAATDLRSMAGSFVNVIIGIAVTIGFIVVLLSMYTAILERTREIGILKSLGASKSYIVTIVVRETVMICLVGILVGTGFGYLGRSAVESKFPLVTVLILPEWVFWSAVLAVFGAVLGAFYPALKAARQDPIEALAYE
jgi:putative ABC transport system permease protein